ncbi:hypothetical protein ABEW79_28175 [Delftia tsuruhatensis]|jgi:hypothetical protein
MPEGKPMCDDKSAPFVLALGALATQLRGLALCAGECSMNDRISM